MPHVELILNHILKFCVSTFLSYHANTHTNTLRLEQVNYICFFSYATIINNAIASEAL